MSVYNLTTIRRWVNELYAIPMPDYALSKLQDAHLNADRFFFILIILHWLAATFITSQAYNTAWFGFISGALLTVSAAYSYQHYRGTRFHRVVTGIVLMLYTVIFIQQHYGLIEMHFHVFIVMAFLSLYKDHLPMLAAALVSIAHHLIFNYLQLYNVELFGMPFMVFNYGCGLDIVLLHGIFVIIEAGVVSLIITRNTQAFVSIIQSNENVKGLNQNLEHQATHDFLTGLPNRQLLMDHLDYQIKNAKRHKDKFAVVFLDLDHFKLINDTMGHDIGDSLLIEVAERIKINMRENDFLARISGDEFVCILTEVRSDNALVSFIERFLESFRTDWYINSHQFIITCSMGVAIYPQDGKTAQDLMKHSDIAMYKAKHAGRDHYSFFSPEMDYFVHQQLVLENDMHRAIPNNEFVLHFQPKVRVEDNRILAAEALIRWNHPDEGLLFPNAFIDLAENTGFILKLGEWVIQAGCQELAKWNSMGLTDIKLSVNVSTRQFQHGKLDQVLKQNLQQYQLDPARLNIEITESVLMENVEKTIKLLEKIKAMGIGICMDDFGTGYSSLSYINRFPICSIKIDKSFIDQLNPNTSQTALADTILAMSEALGVNAVAEGVETEYQLEYLRAKGCQIYQGYLFSKPVESDKFIALVKQQK